MSLIIALFCSVLICSAPLEVAAGVFLTGSKTFEITDYSVVKKGISTGSFIRSDRFTVGGHQWAIKFYPQGHNMSYSNYVSIYVQLKNATSVAKAMYTHRLLDMKTLRWANNSQLRSDVRTFTPNHQWGYYDFMTHSELEASDYLLNDKLVIKTTLWVFEGSSAVSKGGSYNEGNLTSAGVFDNDENLADA
ncbi:hypothetical protein LUZ61_011189 [Rhynchospora tenuis]|uniref:MATH domain-containing protein n=1 Tax=Rhynchospora tenuis TaxID=198213 RepID=A0AAD6F024_9POAL|nr:hypothetical protein LUZ61_011189 [Rhynchospora tenuis]